MPKVGGPKRRPALARPADAASPRAHGTGHGRAVQRVRARDALERVDRLSVAARREAGAREVAPEALRMVGIEAHRLPDPLDAVFRLAEPGQDLALLDDDEVVVRIEAQRAPLVVDGLRRACPG
jgi:hypothetical protein